MNENSPDPIAREQPGRRAFHAVVRGRVQGVGFRDFVRRRARSLGLAGVVRNLPGGEVEVDAEGNPEGLESLVASLHRGPPGARVEGVEVLWVSSKGIHDAFEIGF